MGKFVLVWLLSLGVGYCLFGVNLNAKMGMIDDHEVVSFLGPDKDIAVGEIPQLLSKTEVGKWGEALRFRPVYYTLRIVESMSFRDNAKLWYGLRLIIFALSLTLGFFLLLPLIGAIPSVAGLAYILTWDYWKDIWTRLGPSEIYAVLGLLLFLTGFVQLLRRNQVSNRDVWLCVAGAIICVGSKENFFFLIVPLVYALIARWRQLSNWQRGGLTIAILVGGLVLLAMYLATQAAGTTFYHESLSLFERAKLAVTKTPRILYWYRGLHIFALAVGLNVLDYWRGSTSRRKQIVASSIKYGWILLMLGLTVASQVFFYGAQWPGNNRYDFPGVLAIQLFALVSIVYFPGSWRKIGLIVMTLYTLIWSYHKGYYPIQEAARQNVVRTVSFQNRLDSIRSKLDENQGEPILFESNSPLFYEEIASTRRYLLYYGYPSQMYFRYSGEEEQDALYGALAGSMRQISEVGSGDITDDSWGFLSYKQMPQGDECISISFGETQSVCLE